jgi:hypothetical protein
VQRRAKSHPRDHGPESVLNVLQRVGDLIGTAVLAVILERALVGVTTPAEAASAYGETVWWAAGITALAIVPCIVLVRAERTPVPAAAAPTRA